MTPGMNEIAYDISHLVEDESHQADMATSRAVRAVSTVVAKPVQSGVASAQETLARELMQSAAIHDALVQQYLRMSGATFPEADGK